MTALVKRREVEEVLVRLGAERDRIRPVIGLDAQARSNLAPAARI